MGCDVPADIWSDVTACEGDAALQFSLPFPGRADTRAPAPANPDHVWQEWNAHVRMEGR